MDVFSRFIKDGIEEVASLGRRGLWAAAIHKVEEEPCTSSNVLTLLLTAVKHRFLELVSCHQGAINPTTAVSSCGSVLTCPLC